MIKSKLSFLCILLVVTASLFSVACNPDRRAAQAALADYMKKQGVKNVDFVTFVTSSSVPDHAYLSAVATWQFADHQGNPQKEHIGVIMKKAGNDWSIERMVRYTDDSGTARELLEGKKPMGH